MESENVVNAIEMDQQNNLPQDAAPAEPERKEPAADATPKDMSVAPEQNNDAEKKDAAEQPVSEAASEEAAPAKPVRKRAARKPKAAEEPPEEETPEMPDAPKASENGAPEEGASEEDPEGEPSSDRTRHATRKNWSEQHRYNVKEAIRAEQEKAERMTSGSTTRRNEIPAGWAQVIQAYNNGTIVRNATIIGAEQVPFTDADNNKRVMPVAKCLINGLLAYVPLQELWVNMPSFFARREDELDLNRYLERLLTNINNMAGNDDISLVITAAEYKPEFKVPYAITASRRAALLRTAHNYFSELGDGYEAGQYIEGTVVGVYPNTLIVEFHGVDCVIPGRASTSRYYDTLLDVFSPGQKVMGYIRRIEWPKDDEHVVHLLSDYQSLRQRRDTFKPTNDHYRELDAMLARDRLYTLPELFVDLRRTEAMVLIQQNGYKLREGARYPAIVTDVRPTAKTNQPVFTLWLKDLDVIATTVTANFGSFYELPKRGDRVDFSFTGIDENGRYANGRITRMLSNRRY